MSLFPRPRKVSDWMATDPMRRIEDGEPITVDTGDVKYPGGLATGIRTGVGKGSAQFRLAGLLAEYRKMEYEGDPDRMEESLSLAADIARKASEPGRLVPGLFARPPEQVYDENVEQKIPVRGRMSSPTKADLILGHLVAIREDLQRREANEIPRNMIPYPARTLQAGIPFQVFRANPLRNMFRIVNTGANPLVWNNDKQFLIEYGGPTLTTIATSTSLAHLEMNSQDSLWVLSANGTTIDAWELCYISENRIAEIRGSNFDVEEEN